MKSPLILCFDLDGTIVDLMSSVAFRAYYGTPIRSTSKKYVHADFKEYNFSDLPEYDAKKLLEVFREPGVFSKAYAYPEAVKTVQYCLNRPEDYQVKFVSYFLPNWTLAYQEKAEWLHNIFNTDLDKDFIICKDRTNIVWDVLIDDCLNNVIACQERVNSYILVPDRPWNQGELPENATRCFGWQEIKQHIISIRDDTDYFNNNYRNP